MKTIDWHQRANSTDLCITHFIDGKPIDGFDGERIEKLFAHDGRPLYSFSSGNAEMVDRAVACARRTFDEGVWCGLSIQQRKQVLLKLADLVDSHREQFALFECLDVGKPISQALGDVTWAVSVLKECAEGADKLAPPSSMDGLNYQVRKPLGVVGAIVGWNFPLVLAAQKIGPALVMGNSVVLKPSEFSALSASLLAKLAIEAGIPPGVFNVVQGSGATVGSALAHHIDVNLLTFTGSSATGKQLMVAAGQSNMKRLMLECGGKSPYIIFDDCPKDLDVIAQDVVNTAFRNQGQVCVAGTRLLIHESLKSTLLPKIQEYTARLKPGDPLNPDTNFGPLINKTQLDKVLAYIDSGIDEGAELIQGGQNKAIDSCSNSSQGYYLEPTIFDQVQAHHKIAREEIFGPVLSVFTFKGEGEAIQMANNSCYGLAAYIATENLARAQRLGQRLNAGMVSIVGSSAPVDRFIFLGVEGHRESGFGHEGGLAGLLQYTASSSVHLFI